MSPDPRSGVGNRPPRSKPEAGAADPLAEATTRKLTTELVVAKAAQELAAAKAAAASSEKQEARIANQKTQVEDFREGARRLHAEAVKKAEALEQVHKYREVDAAIAKLEHELRSAELKAAAPDATRSDTEAAETARNRLEKEKEWRHYEEHKRNFTNARKVLDQIEAEHKRAAHKITLERTHAALLQQLQLKEKERERLAESEKKVGQEMAELARQGKELEQKLAAL
jgi:hypothetical protein